MVETGGGEGGTGEVRRAADRKKKRRRRRHKEKSVAESEDQAPPPPEAEEAMDPLEVLGSDLVMKVVESLDARSVARLLAVSRAWRELAASDCIWAPKCEQLWTGKAHIPRAASVRGASKLEAYSMSMKDGKRNRIVVEDLCDHVWEFRFQGTAPAYWLNLDPTWKQTGPAMRRYFHPDGYQTADPGDKVWGGHECTFSVVTSYVGDGQIRQHYVRINRWPQLTVSRKDDWSWEMSNMLCRYNSVPDAEKEGGTGPLFPVAW